MAQGAGIKNAHTIRDIEDFKKNGHRGAEPKRIGFFVCKVEESLLHREIPRPNTDLAENKYTFVRYLERTEEKADAVRRPRINGNVRRQNGLREKSIPAAVALIGPALVVAPIGRFRRRICTKTRR